MHDINEQIKPEFIFDLPDDEKEALLCFRLMSEEDKVKIIQELSAPND